MLIRPEGPAAAKILGSMADEMTYEQVYDWDNLYLSTQSPSPKP